MNRKNFIKTSALGIFGLAACGSIVKTEDGRFKGDCKTTNDILGPFYRKNAPKRTDLTFAGLEGARINLKGKVFQSDCVTPISDALVEIWHCDTEGNYDNNSDDYLHRAVHNTSANGEYSFKTILPGKYLNGKLYRPAHIHIRVTSANSKELVSQIYFMGDPHIEKDPWASTENAKLRIVQLLPQDIKGGLAIDFNIYLSEA